MISGQYGSGRRQAFGEQEGWIAAFRRLNPEGDDAGSRRRIVTGIDMSVPSIVTTAVLAVGAIVLFKLFKKRR